MSVKTALLVLVGCLVWCGDGGADALPIRVFKAGRTGFVSAQGRLLAEPRYACVGQWSEGRIWVRESAQPAASGVFLDERAQPLAMGPARDLASVFPEAPLPRFRDGVASVALPGGGYGYLNRAGRLLGHTSRVGVFMRQDDPLLLVVDQGRHGYIDRQGTLIIQPQFEDAKPFRGGRAAVAEAGRWGLINETGEWIARPAFDDLRWFAEDSRVWSYGQGEKRGLVGRDGSRRTAARFDDVGLVQGDAVTVREGDRWGLVSLAGGICLEPRHAGLQPLGREAGLWAAQSASGHWGVVSVQGRELAPAVYDRIEAPLPGVWLGWRNGVVGLLNPSNGQWRSAVRYLNLVPLPEPFHPLAWAMQPGGRGVVDLTTEDVRVPFRHSHVREWGPFLACQQGRRMTLYDSAGAFVRDWEGHVDGLPEFESLQDGVGVFRGADPRAGAFHASGGTLIRADGSRPLAEWFEAVGSWSAGLIGARRAGRWGLVDVEGRWVVPPRFEALGPFSGRVTPAAEGGRWGLVDLQGEWVCEPVFDAIGGASGGLFPVCRDGGWGLVDENGAERLPCVYDGLEWGSDADGTPRLHGTGSPSTESSRTGLESIEATEENLEFRI